MYDFLLTSEERALRDEVKRFVREEMSSDFLRKMDRDEIVYPREFVEKLAALNLRGIRFPKKYGGREMSWVAEIAATEEIGCLGMALGCAFVMPSIVGEALNQFGTEEQKERFLKPYLEGKLIAAEALTEPRGGSDFFGATTRADLEGDQRAEAFCSRGGRGRLFSGLLPDQFRTRCPSLLQNQPDDHRKRPWG
jgi:acyl-CoA dehydrogenase